MRAAAQQHAPHELGVELIAHSLLHAERARRVHVDDKNSSALAQRVGNDASRGVDGLDPRAAAHAAVARKARYGGRGAVLSCHLLVGTTAEQRCASAHRGGAPNRVWYDAL